MRSAAVGGVARVGAGGRGAAGHVRLGDHVARDPGNPAPM